MVMAGVSPVQSWGVASSDSKTVRPTVTSLFCGTVICMSVAIYDAFPVSPLMVAVPASPPTVRCPSKTGGAGFAGPAIAAMVIVVRRTVATRVSSQANAGTVNAATAARTAGTAAPPPPRATAVNAAAAPSMPRVMPVPAPAAGVKTVVAVSGAGVAVIFAVMPTVTGGKMTLAARAVMTGPVPAWSDGPGNVTRPAMTGGAAPSPRVTVAAGKPADVARIVVG